MPTCQHWCVVYRLVCACKKSLDRESSIRLPDGRLAVKGLQKCMHGLRGVNGKVSYRRKPMQKATLDRLLTESAPFLVSDALLCWQTFFWTHAPKALKVSRLVGLVRDHTSCSLSWIAHEALP